VHLSISRLILSKDSLSLGERFDPSGRLKTFGNSIELLQKKCDRWMLVGVVCGILDAVMGIKAQDRNRHQEIDIKTQE
jgi:hypothetical protein